MDKYKYENIILNQNSENLDEIPDCIVDTIVSDPYGLPSKVALSQSLRILKDGGFAFWMCSPRQDLLSRMIVLLDEVDPYLGSGTCDLAAKIMNQNYLGS